MKLQSSRTLVAASWVLAVVLGGTFVLFGAAKLVGSQGQLAAFERWGFPAWLTYVIGVVEVVGGIGLWGKRSPAYAAALLMGTMLGATATHLSHGEASQVLLPVALFVLLGVLGWLRRPGYLRSAVAQPNPEQSNTI